MSFCLSSNVCKKCGKPLMMFEGCTCLECEKAEQQSSRDLEEIEEVINCDADAETKCKMISNILIAKPHYFEKQESKPDVFDKIISEIEERVKINQCLNIDRARELCWCLDVIDKYKAERCNTV